MRKIMEDLGLSKDHKEIRPFRSERSSARMTSGMHSREAAITNELGLHAKASAAFVRLANQYRASITVEVNGKKANGKSIMGLLMLAASKNTPIRIVTQGEDAEEALDSLSRLVANKFGEEE